MFKVSYWLHIKNLVWFPGFPSHLLITINPPPEIPGTIISLRSRAAGGVMTGVCGGSLSSVLVDVPSDLQPAL